jgi:hypothetical protein
MRERIVAGLVRAKAQGAKLRRKILGKTGNERVEIKARAPGGSVRGATTSIDEIGRVHKRRPFNTTELRWLKHSIYTSIEKGYRIAPYPLNSLNARRRNEEKWIREGLYFVSSLDLKVGMMLVKASADTGILRGRQVRYFCYSTSNGVDYLAIGFTKSLAAAFSKFAALLRE